MAHLLPNYGYILGSFCDADEGYSSLNAEKDLAIQNTCNHRVKYCDIMRILVKWCLSDHEEGGVSSGTVLGTEIGNERNMGLVKADQPSFL